MTFNTKLQNLFEEEEVREDNYLNSVSPEEANNLIKSDCSEFQRQQLVYHLIDREDLAGKEGDYFVYDPLQADKSYNKLYHVMFMDKSDAWEPYPSRKNAVVAYPNKDKITEDGITFVVVPFNRTRLGVAPKGVLEESFNNVSINLGMKFEYFNRSFNIVLNIFNNPEGTYSADTKKLVLSDERFYDNSYNELQSAIRKADEALQSDEGKQVISGVLAEPFNKETEKNVISILEYLQAKGVSIEEMINTLFEPEANSFKHIPFKDFIVGELKDREVWFNNKALLVKESVFDHLQFAEVGFGDSETPDGLDSEEDTMDAPTDEPTDDLEGSDETTDDLGSEEAPIDDTEEVSDEVSIDDTEEDLGLDDEEEEEDL